MLCEQTCLNVEQCDETPDPPTEQCLGSCNGAIESEFTYLAVAACQANVGCGGLNSCYSLVEQPALSECTAACEGASVCPGWPEESCELICSGGLTGLGLSGGETAGCVVSMIGDECSVDVGACAL